MKKLIFAITAVFCAQLAFIGYSYLAQPLNVASISPVDPSGQTVASIDPSSDPFDEVSSGPAILIASNRKPIVAAVKRTAKTPQRKAVDRSADLMAIQKPVIITYRTEYPNTAFTMNNEGDDRGYSPAPKPVSEKKSLVSKVLPVIKKPYDLLKAVAMKLR